MLKQELTPLGHALVSWLSGSVVVGLLEGSFAEAVFYSLPIVSWFSAYSFAKTLPQVFKTEHSHRTQARLVVLALWAIILSMSCLVLMLTTPAHDPFFWFFVGLPVLVILFMGLCIAVHERFAKV